MLDECFDAQDLLLEKEKPDCCAEVGLVLRFVLRPAKAGGMLSSTPDSARLSVRQYFGRRRLLAPGLSSPGKSGAFRFRRTTLVRSAVRSDSAYSCGKLSKQMPR